MRSEITRLARFYCIIIWLGLLLATIDAYGLPNPLMMF